MYVIQYDRIFNTDKFGIIKKDEKEIVFYTPGMSGKVPRSSEGNSIYFFREENVKEAYGLLIDALCEGCCNAIRLEERFRYDADIADQPELLVEKYYKNGGGKSCGCKMRPETAIIDKTSPLK